MENQIAPAETSQRFLAPLSRKGRWQAMSLLSGTRVVTGATKLLPASVCERLIADLRDEQRPLGADRAPGAVARLLRCYPSAALKQRSAEEKQDFEAYCKALAEVFARFCEVDCIAVTDPVSGLPGRQQFAPAAAEVATALTELKTRREIIIANAIAHKAEGERRAIEAREDATRTTVDVAAVDALVASFKANAIFEPDPKHSGAQA